MLTAHATSGVVNREQIGTAKPVYALRGPNHQRPDGAIRVRRTEEALVCRWRQSSATGELECVWRIERIAATPKEKDHTPISCAPSRPHRRIRMGKISMAATALILICVGAWTMRTASRVDASTADAVYPAGSMTNAKNVSEAHSVNHTFVSN